MVVVALLSVYLVESVDLVSVNLVVNCTIVRQIFFAGQKKSKAVQFYGKCIMCVNISHF